jgi:hypothetical protein
VFIVSFQNALHYSGSIANCEQNNILAHFRKLLLHHSFKLTLPIQHYKYYLPYQSNAVAISNSHNSLTRLVNHCSNNLEVSFQNDFLQMTDNTEIIKYQCMKPKMLHKHEG